MHLSIVIPVFNERAKIEQDILQCAQFITDQNLKGEIIVVDDGSSDDSSEVATHTPVPYNVVKVVVRLNPNEGKGAAVKAGILRSQGQYVMFVDSGSCVPMSEAMLGIKLMKDRLFDIAHGSRKLATSKIERPMNPYRQFLSKMFRQFVVWFVGIPASLSDTQCGFKMYKGEIARRLYRDAFTKGFLFDIEIILRAKQLGYSIAEFPVTWRSDPDSRVLPRRLAKSVIPELLSIRQRVNQEKNGRGK